jgi:hypothetical protein
MFIHDRPSRAVWWTVDSPHVGAAAEDPRHWSLLEPNESHTGADVAERLSNSDLVRFGTTAVAVVRALLVVEDAERVFERLQFARRSNGDDRSFQGQTDIVGNRALQHTPRRGI